MLALQFLFNWGCASGHRFMVKRNCSVGEHLSSCTTAVQILIVPMPFNNNCNVQGICWSFCEGVQLMSLAWIQLLLSINYWQLHKAFKRRNNKLRKILAVSVPSAMDWAFSGQPHTVLTVAEICGCWWLSFWINNTFRSTKMLTCKGLTQQNTCHLSLYKCFIHLLPKCFT